jgi:hypothetical protein
MAAVTACQAPLTMSAMKTLEQDLERIADEIRVRIHLATMDAKDAWTQLEPRVHELRRRLEGAGSRVGEELAKLGAELKGELERLRARLGRDDSSPAA